MGIQNQPYLRNESENQKSQWCKLLNFDVVYAGFWIFSVTCSQTENNYIIYIDFIFLSTEDVTSYGHTKQKKIQLMCIVLSESSTQYNALQFYWNWTMVVTRGPAHHVTRGRKTLQMHGFPIQNMWERGYIFIGVNKISIQIKLVLSHSACPYKKCTLKWFQSSKHYIIELLFFYLVCNQLHNTATPGATLYINPLHFSTRRYTMSPFSIYLKSIERQPYQERAFLINKRRHFVADCACVLQECFRVARRWTTVEQSVQAARAKPLKRAKEPSAACLQHTRV